MDRTISNAEARGVAACCSVLQNVAVRITSCESTELYPTLRHVVLQSVAACCGVLQCVAECCRVLQCVAECCRVLQSVAECCRVSQCVAECRSVLQCP